MKEIKDRLQEALQIRNITRSELSTLSGVPKPMITDYIKGRYKPKQDNIYALSKALRVNPAWFMGYEDADIDDLSYLEQGKVIPRVPSPAPPEDFSELYAKYPNIKPIKKVKIPMLGNIACGEPTFADEEHETYIETDGQINADFCLTCSGDSMEPKLRNGDIVFIRKQDIVDDGQIAAVIIEDEATLKRVYYDKPNNVLTLVAENPKYRPFVYSGEQLDHIRILGRAVSLYRRVKQ